MGIELEDLTHVRAHRRVSGQLQQSPVVVAQPIYQPYYATPVYPAYGYGYGYAPVRPGFSITIA